MTAGFSGFPPDALKFLKALKRHNDRAWFQPRKEQFDRFLREPMLVLIGEINQQMMRFAPDYVTDPPKAIFRIYRDTRFSHDKTPYKTHVAAVFSHRSLPRNLGAGFYFQVSTEKVGIGGGIYRPGPDILKKLRGGFAEDPSLLQKEIRSIAAKKKAGRFEGDQTARIPKGFDPAHPAADLLKYRSLFFYDELKPETMLEAGLKKEIVNRFRQIANFVHLIDRPLAGQRKFTVSDAF